MTPISLPVLLTDHGLLSVVLDLRAIDIDKPLVLEGLPLRRLKHWLTAMGWGWQDGADGLYLDLTPDLPLPQLLAMTEVVMGYFPDVDPAQLARRSAHIAAQAAARQRAATEVAPATLRHDPEGTAWAIDRRIQPYAAYFAVEEIDFTHQKFSGGESGPIRRAVFVSGDAVTVLPYDPQRDRVLLVEQLRSGPLVRGDRNPWQLEAVAGRIDPGETPHQAAVREAVEEAGLDLTEGSFQPIAEYYPSPGTSAEKLYSFLALTDLPDGLAGVHGLDSEDEDIKSHLVGFEQLMDLVQTGEISNAPTILSALWLTRARAGLRG